MFDQVPASIMQPDRTHSKISASVELVSTKMATTVLANNRGVYRMNNY